jgi:hypothetical protein
MAPTSGTNKTLGGLARHARDQSSKAQALAGSPVGAPAITIAFPAGQKAARRLGRPFSGNQKP